MNDPDNKNKSTTPQPRCVIREPKGDSSKNQQGLSKFRFSMRTLFIIVTLLCVLLVPLSVKLYQARQQRLAVAWVLANGGEVDLNESGEVIEVLLNDTQITDAGLERLKCLTSLTVLELYNTQVTGAGLEHLKDLTSLNLNATKITLAVTKIRKLGGHISLNKSGEVIEVNLSGTGTTDAGLEHLKGMTSLTNLQICQTQITDAGLEHLKGMTSLNTLSLMGPKITDAGLEHLKDMTSLTDLTLFATEVTDAGLEHLKGLTSLKKLDIISTSITDEGRSELKAALPKLR